MKRILLRSKVGICSLVIPIAIAVIMMVYFTGRNTTVHASSAEVPASASCAAPPYREFDFWVGDWDVFDIGSPNKVARARVDLILGGCVLREDYQGADGHKGQSFTIYDASRKVWHQSWVTNRGEMLVIEGGIEAGSMILSGEDHAKSALVRGEWKPEKGNVRETAVTSTDGGKTWKPWFDLTFQRAAEAGSDGDSPAAEKSKGNEEKIVAALDTQYQAAVKDNDVATMGRLLADDFVLATGSGKTYSKADLLEEARSGRYHYEHQEDAQQTVRIWGDTAVVTANLWAKGTNEGKPFDYSVWFSDTYLRTSSGWRYVFGQSSLPLPRTP
jgi:ketosteroid isomerase-like protein